MMPHNLYAAREVERAVWNIAQRLELFLIDVAYRPDTESVVVETSFPAHGYRLQAMLEASLPSGMVQPYDKAHPEYVSLKGDPLTLTLFLDDVRDKATLDPLVPNPRRSIRMDLAVLMHSFDIDATLIEREIGKDDSGAKLSRKPNPAYRNEGSRPAKVVVTDVRDGNEHYSPQIMALADFLETHGVPVEKRNFLLAVDLRGDLEETSHHIHAAMEDRLAEITAPAPTLQPGTTQASGPAGGRKRGA